MLVCIECGRDSGLHYKHCSKRGPVNSHVWFDGERPADSTISTPITYTCLACGLNVCTTEKDPPPITPDGCEMWNIDPCVDPLTAVALKKARDAST